ncbi:MAG: hypothetical protein ABIJ20_03360 [Nanoarchaeota archaeon]|nr:hypothetical protein [Nanoarchaeota archaeon]MBU1445453.1 hypothetical protein [Nanoarchaeota archaeon]MBU2420261.1 hypothetical protein [Nanoarchaeota archaeon]MBU2474976.1 hypothetical protein [Nanoarchaeota archaeon]
MSDKDIIIKEGDLDISQTAIFNFNDFYSTTKTWFKDNEYGHVEKKYEETIKGKTKDIKIGWEGNKKFDDYTKAVIKMKIKVSDSQQVEHKDEKLTKGTLKISLSADMVTDYDDKVSNPMGKLWRGLQEKFFSPHKRFKFQKEIQEDANNLYNRIKSFLNIQKYN